MWSEFKVKLPFRVKKGSLKRICTGEKSDDGGGVRVLYIVVENYNNIEQNKDGEDWDDYEF